MKLKAEKNTVPGVTFSNQVGLGHHLPNPFFDSYSEEVYTCCDIINSIEDASTASISITVSFDKVFLKKIVKSHIYFIQDMEKKNFANRTSAPR
jgi:hypothetical protein